MSDIVLFFIYIAIGVVISILFDIFRILRKTFKTSDFVTYLEDVLFWLVAGSILIFSIFNFSNGELRGYIFLSLLIGIIFYMISISKYFIKINVILLKFLKKFIVFIIYPIKVLLTFILKPIRYIRTIFLKKFNNITKKLNILNKKEGF